MLGPQNVPTFLERYHGEFSVPFGDWGVTLLGATGQISTAYSLVPAQYPVKWIVSDRSEKDPFLTGELRVASPDFSGLFGLKDLFGFNLGNSRFLAGVFASQTKIVDLNLRVT